DEPGGIQQYRGARVGPLYRACLRVRACGGGAVARYRGCHLPDPAQETGPENAGHREAGIGAARGQGAYRQDGLGEAAMIGLQHYLSVAAILFALSVAGIFINRRNLILLLMCIELLLLAVNFNFVAFSRYTGDDTGQVFVFFILTVAAAEAAIGLAILVVLFRNRRSINVQELDSMKG